MSNIWEVENGKWVKNFSFETFEKGIEFVNDVAEIAKLLNHHPEIHINYKKVRLSLFTFDAGAITEKDYTLAQKIDELL